MYIRIAKMIKIEILNVGEDIEQLTPPCIADGNVKWYNYQENYLAVFTNGKYMPKL